MNIFGSKMVFLLIGVLIGVLATLSFSFLQKNYLFPRSVPCTLDAKICPDGSSINRIPPTCEFASCPISIPSPTSLVITPTPVETLTQQECLAKGGVWQKWGLGAKLESCQIPANDADKSCYDGSECDLGNCISYDDKLPGRCAMYKYMSGCYSIVTNRQAGPALCVD